MRLADQAAVMTAGRLGERLVGILSSVVLVRVFAPDVYGTLLQVFMIGGLAGSLFPLGFPASLMYYVPLAPPASRRALFARTVGLTAAGAAIAAAGVVLGAPLLASWMHNPSLRELSPLIAAYVFLFILDRLVEPALLSLGDAVRAGLLDLVGAVLLVAATVLPALLGYGLVEVLLGSVAVYLLRFLYCGWVLFRLPRPPHGDPAGVPSLREQFGFAAPLGLSTIPSQYNRQIDGLLVSFFFTPAIYAVYARGAFELPLVELVPFTLAAVILPRLVELWAAGDRATFLALWNRSLRVSSILLFPAFAFCLVFAREIITTLFTEQYAGATPVFQVYLMALPLRITSYGTILRAVGDTRGILTSTLYALIATALISPVLCLKFGPLGASTGYVLSQFIAVAYLLTRIARHSQLRLAEMLPWRSLAIGMAIVLPCAAAARLATVPFASGPVRLLAGGPIFLVLVIAGMLRFGLLDDAERELIRSWWSRLAGSRTAAKTPASPAVQTALDTKDV